MAGEQMDHQSAGDERFSLCDLEGGDRAVSLSSRRRLACRRLLVAAVWTVVAIGAWHCSAYPRGMFAAWLDGCRGRHEIKVRGLGSEWNREYERLLSERYGIRFRSRGGCLVSPSERWYDDGYNSVVQARIEAQFGKDVFAECYRDAQLLMHILSFL